MKPDPRSPRWLLIGVMTTMALVLSACGGSDETAGGSGGGGSNGGFVIAIADEPSTLDPQSAEDGNERAINDNVYEGLVTRDGQTNEVLPLLATELPTQIEPTTWEFKLREGVKFSNGEDFTAESAAASVNRIVDPNYTSAQLDYYGPLAGAEVVDDTTIHVKTSEPDPVFPARMARLKMVPLEASQESNFLEEPVGTGPYKVDEWQRGQHIKLSVNEDYWGDAPSIKNVTVRFISEAGTRTAGLRTGEIHLATLLPPEQAADAPQTLHRVGTEFPVYRLRNYEGPLKDPRVRQALNYAVDKEAIANDLFGGYATVAACQPASETSFGYNPNLDAYPYDPDKARELLEEAGYNGEPVSLLGATGRWLKDAEMHEAIMGFLSEVGVNIDPSIMPFSSYLDYFLPTLAEGASQPDMGFVSASDELFDASKMHSYYDSQGAMSSYLNEDSDAAIQRATNAADEDERLAAYNDMFRVGCEDDPAFLFTVNLEDIYGASESLDWEPRSDGSLYIPEMSLTN